MASAVAAAALHGFDGAATHNGYIETHVLPGLSDFDDHQRPAGGQAPGALDGFIGALHGFDGHAGAGPV